ncbi:MAG: nuclear transport factor 2 family protein [Okeania sp. SIO3B3]|nr:nuclear transport factor 2 family protein [Okeania sp. SIO3B3]
MDNPVAKFFAALKDKDLDRALSVVAEDVVFEAQGPNTVPIYGKFIGKKGVVEFISILGELFNTEAFEIYKLVAVDNYIFAHGYMQHRVKKTERIFKCEYALVCTSKNGLITSYKMFEDTAALSEAYSSDRS